MKSKLLTFIFAVVLIFSFSSCNANTSPSPSPVPSSSPTPSPNPTPDTTVTVDLLGNPITVPVSIEKIISMGPANTEILVGLGLGDKIIATDTYSTNIDGIAGDIPLFSMMEIDVEQMINLRPDVIVITEMSMAGGDDPLKLVKNAGICVIYIPSGNSIAEIVEDIKFIAEVTNTEPQGEKIIADMEKSINAIKEVGEKIAGTSSEKTVYFEIAAAPALYSFGTGVFLNEMIDLIGAKNILSDQKSWVAITDEAILAANPDVILTNVNYIDDPTGEIMSRPGWEAITAVQNSDVYYIDTDASSRPSQYIIKALEEMAKAVYPES